MYLKIILLFHLPKSCILYYIVVSSEKANLNFGKTPVKDIYAAGNCCGAKDLLLNINRAIAIWLVAVKQGKIAGYNMAGVKKDYPGSLAMNSVDLCRIPTISGGKPVLKEKIIKFWRKVTKISLISTSKNIAKT